MSRIIITRHAFPDLALRERVAYRRQRLEEMKRSQQEVGAIFEAIANSVPRSRTDDEFAEHLKGCVDCKRRVLDEHKRGAKIPPMILAAAGIDVIGPN